MATAIAALVLALVGGYPATGLAAANALAPDDLAGDRLDRATLIALPSVYRVEVTLSIPAVETITGERIRVPHGGRVVERGTATAVAPNGWLVSASHLVSPDQHSMARLGYQHWQRSMGAQVSDTEVREWAINVGARAVGARVVRIEVSQADPGTGLSSPRRWVARVAHRSDLGDLALLRIRAPGAPALPLVEAVGVGSPVATIGYGRPDAWEAAPPPADRPSVRRGRLERVGLLDNPERRATVVSTAIQRGDSGGPAVDEQGFVRGIVILRGEGGGIIEQSATLRRLLEEAEVRGREGPAGRAFRDGMASLWSLDLRQAERHFATVRETFADHTLAEAQSVRAADLTVADYRLESVAGRRGVLLGLGVLAAVLGMACAARLGWLSRGGAPPTGRR